MSDSVIPTGSLVLITGATGSVGGAVADEVLKAGYKVRAVIRNQQKGKYLEEAFHERYGKDAFHTVLVEDLTVPGALDEAMKDCAGVIHTASDVTFRDDPNLVITPVVEMAKNVLASAAKTPTIKRFVFTSSSSAVPPVAQEGHITPASWLPDDVIDMAWSKPYGGMEKSGAIYTASKILGERACWDFVRDNKPHFEFNSIVPNAHIGAFIHPKLISSVNGMILGVWHGDESGTRFLAMMGPQAAINLEDSGKLHLAALILPEIKSERLLAFGEGFTADDVLDAMHTIDPSRKLPAKAGGLPRAKATVDMSRSMEALAKMGKPQLTGLVESVRQNVTSLPEDADIKGAMAGIFGGASLQG
ncbi:hypothetical protein BAUCODRAFT_433600 [Baudoinia panamericana UAMH 10762]|uniref:NAD-dependent epimerase/dehydratase domain-containing protein n=1 Tax=Baudoinia panamericana (strain UAMH 10762) TaxID=717646 RepID=M2NCN5_BAUPA|nr:uncharacterized protein BAUCODRAFT_433600 [Baudoinia panamericana UAMH 10762]EMC96944.1 hypothetical protein BAUCODRAFT_433600 [Baudoinia panamericana UAMH 10762]